MNVSVDRVEYFTVEVGKTFIEIGSFENLEKKFEKIRALLEECGGDECWIDATDGVDLVEVVEPCQEFFVRNLRVIDCTGYYDVDSLAPLGIRDGYLWISKDGVTFNFEGKGWEITVHVASPEEVPGALLMTSGVFEEFGRRFPAAERVSVDFAPGDCRVTVSLGGVSYDLPCLWRGSLPSVEGLDVSVVRVDGDRVVVSGVKKVGDVAYHLFMVPVEKVDEFIARWRPVAEAVGALEFEVGDGFVFVLEPFLAGVRGGELGYFIEDAHDLEGAERFFDLLGLGKKFREEVSLIARLLEGFDGGLFDRYRGVEGE